MTSMTAAVATSVSLATVSGYEDGFARAHLPPPAQWPELCFDLPELHYPARLNATAALLDAAVAAGGGARIAVVGERESWTYRELQERVDRIAHVLRRDLGLATGKRVLLRGANTPMMAACILAVFKAGCIAVPTMPLLRARELGVIIDKARVDAVLCAARLRAELDAVTTQPSVIFFDDLDDADALEARMAHHEEPFAACDSAADDVCLISFTSGTTGVPKATMHFHRDLLAICDCFPRHTLGTRADDIFIGTPPLASRTGTASLRQSVSAGEALPVATRTAWQEATGLRMVDGIGATELLHIFISAAGDAVRAGATGKPVPGYRACILDVAGAPVGPGVVGRLAVKGPTGCRYLDDPRQADYVCDGWNLTGDAYEMDADGYFYYRARTDDMIISAGYNIAGVEVEDALLRHPAVAECAVVGRADAERGMVVEAHVVLRAGVARDEATSAALQAFCKAQIAPYKYPRVIHYADQLPRTETGKLQRFKLRDA